MELKKHTIDISWKTILKVLFSLFICYILFLTKDIFVLVLFSFILSILFEPLIGFFEKKNVSRAVSIFLTYLLFFVLLGFFFYWILPIFITEVQQFIRSFPYYFEEIATPLKGIGIKAFESFDTFNLSLQEWLTGISSNFINFIVSFFGNIFSIVTVFFLSIFFSIEKEELKRLIGLLIPEKKRGNFFDLWQRCQLRTIAWFGTRILGGFFVGLASYFSLLFLDMKHDLALAVLAALANFIPFVGSIFVGFILALLALLDSWTKSLLVVLIFTLIQQIENNIIMPISSKKFIGLPASITLITLLIGGQLLGIVGAILAIPLVGIIYEFLRDLKNNKYV